MRTVQYQNRSFQVVDARYNDWDFWGTFSTGGWEHKLLKHIAEIPTESMIFDVGAWIGPISMWAASFGIRSVAIEPDPAAFEVLQQHVEANNFGGLITLEPIGVAAENGLFALNTQNGGGDSQSSMARTNMPDSIEVEGRQLHHFIQAYGIPDMIKMDIEGGEGFVVPAAGPELRRLGIPLMLSLHWHWLPEGTRGALEEELSHWRATTIENDTVLYEI